MGFIQTILTSHKSMVLKMWQETYNRKKGDRFAIPCRAFGSYALEKKKKMEEFSATWLKDVCRGDWRSPRGGERSNGITV